MAAKKNNKPVEVVDNIVQVIEDNTFIEPVEGVTELSQMIKNEIQGLEDEIKNYKQKIKEAQSRIKDLSKKPSEVSSKSKIISWFMNNPDCDYLQFVNYAVGECGISGIYANTLWKKCR